MGSNVSVDWKLTSLEDLLSISPSSFVKFSEEQKENSFSCHLKIWRFAETAADYIRSNPVNLNDPQAFSASESYLVLAVYKDSAKMGKGFPAQGWVDGLANLSPRGLENVFSCSDDAKKERLKYSTFVWNGKKANSLVKAVALTKSFELDGHLTKGKISMLSSIFGGCFIAHKKINESKLLTVASQSSIQRPTRPIYLLNWIWPDLEINNSQPLYPFFRDFLLSESGNAQDYSRNRKISGKLIQSEALAENEVPEIPKKRENAVGSSENTMKTKIPNLSFDTIVSKEEQKEKYAELNENRMNLLERDEDVRDTVRKELKLDFYNDQCTEIDPGLFIGGHSVAKDFEKLKENGITHILNCAANICGNYFPDDMVYSHYFMKDDKSENIECLFYETSEFISSALEEGGKVFVHCMQGVSRSVTIVIAYLIFKKKMSFESAYELVQTLRKTANPNSGFQVQLIWWEKRLNGNYEDFPITPRVFSISSHQPESPCKVVCRLLMQNPFQKPDSLPLDPRGIYLVQGKNSVFVWEGENVGSNKNVYRQAMNRYIQLLQRYEKAGEAVFLRENEESEEFWELFGGQPETVSCESYELDDWFPDVLNSLDKLPRCDEEENFEVFAKKPKLFVYPDTNGMTVFDDDELAPDVLAVLCTQECTYVWKHQGFQYESQAYVQEVTRLYHDGAGDVLIVTETPGNESEDFMNLF